MVFTEKENKAEKDTLTGELAEMLFRKFARILRNPEADWYSDSQTYWWIIWNHDAYEDGDSEAIVSIRRKFLELLKERLEDEERWQWKN